MKRAHPRDTFVTLYGRKPVLEALGDSALEVARVFVAHSAQGSVIKRILNAAAVRGVEVERANAQHVNRISRNARHDQGVAADVRNPRMTSLDDWLESAPPRATLLALDGVTTPANVGMILRTATAMGLDGVVLPRRGCPEVGPLVIKASAGVALRAPILRCERITPAIHALRANKFHVSGLAAPGIEPAARAQVARTVYVLGNESEGINPELEALLDERLFIPMCNGVESLNVAAAAAILCYKVRSLRSRSL